MVEIILNLLGLDDLADYSEFVFEEKAVIVTSNTYEISTFLTPIPCPNCSVSFF